MSKVVVITGGSKGIGKALANLYVINGDHVIIIARNEMDNLAAVEDLQKTKSKDSQIIKSFAVDVSNENKVHAGINSIIEEFKRIDLLITCAGLVGRDILKASPPNFSKKPWT